MRHFNDKERQIINLLVEQFDKPNFVLLNVFNDWFLNTNIAYDFKEKILVFANITDEQILKIEQDICKRALFIQYLIDQNYITIIHDYTDSKDKFKIGNCENETLYGKPVPDFLAHILEESCNRIYVLDSLVELKENNFLTYEDQQLQLAGKQLSEAKAQTDKAAESLEQARAQTRNSYWAIGIAFISVIISITLPIIMNQYTSQKVVWEPITEYLDSTLVLTGDTIVDKLQQGNVLLSNSVEVTQDVSKTIKTKKCK